MPVTRITSLGGRILSVSRDGVISNLVPDPQGNTVALRDSTGAITDTYRYWPYGAERAHSGVSAASFTWQGAAGAYQDSSRRTYVRARTTQVQLGCWTSRDPLNTRGTRASGTESRTVADASPITRSDPSGLQVAGPWPFPFPIFGGPFPIVGPRPIPIGGVWGIIGGVAGGWLAGEFIKGIGQIGDIVKTWPRCWRDLPWTPPLPPCRLIEFGLTVGAWYCIFSCPGRSTPIRGEYLDPCPDTIPDPRGYGL